MLDARELDLASGAGFKGFYANVGLGATVGPFSANVGIGVRPGSADHHGELYDTSSMGMGRVGLGANVGGTVGAVFGRDDASYDDVLMGGNQTVNFLVGRVSWNENGAYVGVGPTGIGYSRGSTVSSDSDDLHAPLDPGDGRDHANDAAPELTDWSGAFGDHEGEPEASSLAHDAGVDDIGATPDTGFESAADDAGE